MKIASIKNNRLIWTIFWAVCGAAALVFLLWKCRYGYGNDDEAFYLSIPLRLCQGDGLFAQEWHLSQMSGLLLYPIMRIYLWIAPNTDGIFLTFRYIYVLFQTAAAVFIYIRLRKWNNFGAGFAALCFMIFAPYGVMALSYNSMGIINLSVALIIMLTAEKHLKLQYIIAGLFFAGAVLCCPYLILLYVIYLIAVVVVTIIRRKKNFEARVFCFKTLLFFTIGAAILAVIFLAFVLSRAGISKILESFPYILKDTAHESKGIFNTIKTYFQSILAVNKWADIAYAGIAAATIAALIDRKRHSHGFIYFSIAAVFTMCAVAVMMLKSSCVNYLMFPINCLAPVCMIINWEKPVRKTAAVMWLPAMIYTVCIHASSNQYLNAISQAAAVAFIASVMIISMTVGNMMTRSVSTDAAKAECKNACKVKKAIVLLACCLLLAVQLATLVRMRYKYVLWETVDMMQDTRYEKGLNKGLYISLNSQEIYEKTAEAVDYINSEYKDAESIVFVTDNTWQYLMCPDKKIAAFSAWLVELDNTIAETTMEKFMKYYQVNPEKIPDIIYLGSSYAAYLPQFLELAEYEVDEQADGGLVLARNKS